MARQTFVKARMPAAIKLTWLPYAGKGNCTGTWAMVYSRGPSLAVAAAAEATGLGCGVPAEGGTCSPADASMTTSMVIHPSYSTGTPCDHGGSRCHSLHNSRADIAHQYIPREGWPCPRWFPATRAPGRGCPGAEAGASIASEGRQLGMVSQEAFGWRR